MGNKKVRVGIIGVGNCASSLVQGVEYYKHAAETDAIPGLMHVNLGGYHISDIEFSAAIDIDSTKVGKDLSEAIFSGPNNTYKFASPPSAGVAKNLQVILDEKAVFVGYRQRHDNCGDNRGGAREQPVLEAR